MAKRLIPLFNRILVEKIVPPSKTNSGILLPEKTTKVFFLHFPFLHFHSSSAELMQDWVVLKNSNFESSGFCLSFSIGSWLVRILVFSPWILVFVLIGNARNLGFGYILKMILFLLVFQIFKLIL